MLGNISFLWWIFSLPFHWPYCPQMHKLFCHPNPELFLFLMAMTVKGSVIRTFSVWLKDVLIWWVGWTSRISVNVLPAQRTGIGHCLPRTSTNTSSHAWWWGRCVNDLWPSPSILLCVRLSLPVSWLWQALWPHGWVMRCLVWRLRNNKHSALFFTPCCVFVSCSFCGRWFDSLVLFLNVGRITVYMWIV